MAAINLTPGTLNGITYLLSDQTSTIVRSRSRHPRRWPAGFTVNGFYVWSRALESGEFVPEWRDDRRAGLRLFRQAIHRAKTTRWAPSAADLGRNISPCNTTGTKMRPSPACGHPTTSTDSNKIVSELVNAGRSRLSSISSPACRNTVSSGSNLNFDSKGKQSPPTLQAFLSSSAYTAAVYAAPRVRAQPA